jgi:hypothetical protein
MLRFDGQGESDRERVLLLSESVSPQALDLILTFLYTDRLNHPRPQPLEVTCFLTYYHSGWTCVTSR